MATFILRRFIQAILVIIFITFLVFMVIRLLPGDPILIYLSSQDLQTLTIEQMNAARAEFGLDKPLAIQYVNWVGNLFHADLGMSIFYHQEVSGLIAERLPVTLSLGIIAFVVSNLLGIIAGSISALRRGKWIDTTVTIMANIGITVPSFWMGILLIYFFGLKLDWFPRFGYVSPATDLVEFLRHAFLPIICLAIFPIASTARQTRSSILEVTRQDYIRTAWAKGLSERAVVLKHMLKNGLIPVVTLSGIGLSYILGGSVLIETVFNIPGMGRLGVEAIQSQDYAIVQAIILFTALMVVLVNLLVDIAYGWLDPRIRYS
ncbi:MAG: ABC transporter permease [Dehalococcoidales bacterium]